MSFLDLLSHYLGFLPSALIGALLVFWLLAWSSWTSSSSAPTSTCRTTVAASTPRRPVP